MEKRFHYVPAAKNSMLKDLDHVWEHYVEPFRIAPHVWMVGGNDDVCAYLLDSGEGLIMLDTAMAESNYLVIDSIHRIGFDPRDIKVILLSHWHWDHVNGCRFFQEISHARVYLSREDEAEHQKHKDETEPIRMTPYTVNAFYDDSKPIVLGRFTIHTKLVPGHTPGATCMFFDDTDETTGKTYHCAFHGGAGTMFMRPKVLDKLGYPREMAFRFIELNLEMAAYDADIVLPSHTNQLNLMANLPADKNDYSSFVTDYAWKDFCRNRAAAVMSYYPDKYDDPEKLACITH